LLPVVDNLRRAIEAAGNSESAEGLLEGVQLVAQQLDSVLQQHHCTPMEVTGKLFDPHLHEAIGKFPNDQYGEGTIVEVTQVGYQLHDRVVRPAQVLVSAGSPEAPAGDASQQPAPETP
jgi:molecular chaperone GrpE